MSEGMRTIQGRPGDGVTVTTSLRLPREVRDNLKIQAIRAGRSFNTHVVMIMAEALSSKDQGHQGGNPDGLL